jgi:hypothetical protein
MLHTVVASVLIQAAAAAHVLALNPPYLNTDEQQR